MTQTKTVRMEDAMEDIRDDVSKVDEQLESVRDEAQELENTTPELQKKWEQLKKIRQEVARKLGVFEEMEEEWDGTEFEVVRYMSIGEINQIRDTLASDMDIARSEVPERDFGGRIEGEVFSKQVLSVPDGAPENPNDLPETIADWLQDEIQKSVTSTTVEDKWGNMTLDEAVSEED